MESHDNNAEVENALHSEPKRFLIACHAIVVSGGIYRFERIGKILAEWGHDLAFVTLDNNVAAERESALPVLTMEEAADSRWDAVMVPGSGFPSDTIEKFRQFKDKKFGIRVQHILNDQSRRSSFLKVNQEFSPHLVIFNNTNWPAGTFTEFQADRFHTLVGAVDHEIFRPNGTRHFPITSDRWVIGGLANKNPHPLLEALSELPLNARLRLYGPDRLDIEHQYADLIQSGRLELVGILEENELSRFYQEVDCVVACEAFAGWSNLAAEAAASGVPLVCTQHGTDSFAENNETALVIETPQAQKIATNVRKLMTNFGLCSTLIKGARKKIKSYSWESYSRSLLDLIYIDGHKHYSHAPELGLFGKWKTEDRLAALQPLLDRAKDMTVIDFGAAEGIVGHAFLTHGAAAVHGFDSNKNRVCFANELCRSWDTSNFRVANLSSWENFVSSQADLLADHYDIVLYLGIHHHLPQPNRMKILKNAAALTQKYFAIRTPPSLYQSDCIEEVLTAMGLQSMTLSKDREPPHLGTARIYERVADNTKVNQ